ncbi:hypothetical protein EDEG_00013 [Edhazardia aedis USNM 41457]|uniref:Methyltransferase small domain-containing protein n=1 Tax=Edhazardia aedis (strain USNM 41457) TaxID=1003232 RepID=J8ZU15_EDHAE|nr:hypothetical protein EDEG_00013 [Edhazardia aedis USNM 41457]|eukprot:EJW03143.1 hypothetical protein EDEG_00013 [Edhazardia aedis USNM 41457]
MKEEEPKFYQASDDTFAMIDALDAQKNYINDLDPKVIVEIGCGSGVITEHLIKSHPSAMFIATDINPYALDEVKKIKEKHNADVLIMRSDLMSNLDTTLVDIVIFNPPYVETSGDLCDFELFDGLYNTKKGLLDFAYSGGKNGAEVIYKFIKALGETKCIYLLCIRYNKPFQIMLDLKKMGYECFVTHVKKILGESIYIIRITKKNLSTKIF